MQLVQRLLYREPTLETKCPHCGVPAPVGDVECTACGWNLHESYHDPISGVDIEPEKGGARPTGSIRRSDLALRRDPNGPEYGQALDALPDPRRAAPQRRRSA